MLSRSATSSACATSLKGVCCEPASLFEVNAQLIDAESGAHLWAERFDGSLDAVFEIQDQIAAGVTGALGSALQSAQIHGSADLPEQAKARDPPPDRISAERRQLTVMSCNLAGSAALASRLDPEDLRDLITAYHRAIAEIVTRFQGFIVKQLGEGGHCQINVHRAEVASDGIRDHAAVTAFLHWFAASARNTRSVEA